MEGGDEVVKGLNDDNDREKVNQLTLAQALRS